MYVLFRGDIEASATFTSAGKKAVKTALQIFYFLKHFCLEHLVNPTCEVQSAQMPLHQVGLHCRAVALFVSSTCVTKAKEFNLEQD